MPKLTIHTATYNRGYILGQAFASLKKQTCKDFEWIITDDGSTDNTNELVESWLSEDYGFPIVYNRLQHVGVPRAINSGIKLTGTPWFMRLDSDDCLLPEAVEKILVWLEEIKDIPGIGGIGFARCYPNGKYMKNQIPIIDDNIGYVDATHIERQKYNLDMDMCEVHRIELLRQYPLQCYPGEYFAPEQLNYYQIALAGYSLRWRKDKLYICDYLRDGLTKDNRIVKNNPMGYAMMYNQNLLIHHRLRECMRDAMQMTALCYYANHMEYLKESNNQFLTYLTYPAGVMLGRRRQRQFANME